MKSIKNAYRKVKEFLWCTDRVVRHAASLVKFSWEECGSDIGFLYLNGKSLTNLRSFQLKCGGHSRIYKLGGSLLWRVGSNECRDIMLLAASGEKCSIKLLTGGNGHTMTLDGAFYDAHMSVHFQKETELYFEFVGESNGFQ